VRYATLLARSGAKAVIEGPPAGMVAGSVCSASGAGQHRAQCTSSGSGARCVTTALHFNARQQAESSGGTSMTALAPLRANSVVHSARTGWYRPNPAHDGAGWCGGRVGNSPSQSGLPKLPPARRHAGALPARLVGLEAAPEIAKRQQRRRALRRAGVGVVLVDASAARKPASAS